MGNANDQTYVTLDAGEITIIKDPALECLLFDRNLVGQQFIQACRTASAVMISHWKPQLLVEGPIAELVILSKGLCYQIALAYENVMGSALDQNFVATRRVKVSGSNVDVEVSYSNIDSPAVNLIIGDTIASGETVCAALSHYLTVAHLQRLYLMSFAGTTQGARKILQFCSMRGIECHILYGLAAFGLGDNGFDLSFLHPDTIADSRYRDRAREQFSGKPASAIGWDFGSQGMALRKYRALCWVEAEYWELRNSSALLEKERPNDVRMIEKEHGAFRTRFPDLSYLCSPGM